MMANIFFFVVVCILLFIQESNAYPSGAGGICQVETPGVFGPGQFGEPSPHASDLDFADWFDNPFAFLLLEYGLEVQLDGVPMVDAFTDFAAVNLYDPNVPHEISVVASDGSPFKGVLLRAESLFLEDVSGALLPTDSTLQDLAICADQFAVGLTHTDSSDKQRVDAAFEYVPFDETDIVIFEVTVVVNTLEWYYAPFLLALLDLTAEPTLSPTLEPTLNPTDAPSPDPTAFPTPQPTPAPIVQTEQPTNSPTPLPTPTPTSAPVATTLDPTSAPIPLPSSSPSSPPTVEPTRVTSDSPSLRPSTAPSIKPPPLPSQYPSELPSLAPVASASLEPSASPSSPPTGAPTSFPSDSPSAMPSTAPTIPAPSDSPSALPSFSPSATASLGPTATLAPTNKPTLHRKEVTVTFVPTIRPTSHAKLVTIMENPSPGPRVASLQSEPPVPRGTEAPSPYKSEYTVTSLSTACSSVPKCVMEGSNLQLGTLISRTADGACSERCVRSSYVLDIRLIVGWKCGPCDDSARA